MLQAKPTSIFSSRYALTLDGQEVGWLKLRVFLGKGTLNCAGREIHVRYRGLRRVAAHDAETNEKLAEVVPRGIFGTRADLLDDSTRLQLRASFWGRTHFVEDGDREVGRVRPRGVWTRAVEAHFPESMSPVLQALTLYYVLCRARRRRNSS